MKHLVAQSLERKRHDHAPMAIDDRLDASPGKGIGHDPICAVPEAV
jgi:hypothetical protein